MTVTFRLHLFSYPSSTNSPATGHLPRRNLRGMNVKGGARWSSGQCARHAIAEAKHRSQWPVLGWMTKIYYLELLRASEGTLSRWSRCICSR
jgi:hypothetical protein